MKTITKLWLVIGALVILTPIGLIVPGYFKSAPAWGEGADRYGASNFGYLISAALGIVVICAATLLVGKILTKQDR